jgi:hypothetical protein
MAANAGSDSGSLDLMLVENAVDNVRHVVELHDLTIDDRVGLEIFKAQVHQVKAIALLLQLDGFDRAGTNVKTNKISLAHTFLKHIYLFLTTKRERIRCCCRNRARAFIALETRLLAVFVRVTGLSFFKTSFLDGRLLRQA